MFIETLSIEGYRNFNEPIEISLHKGLNVLVGENGTGKSSIIDALRLLLQEDEYGRAGIHDADFNRPFKKDSKPSDHIQIWAKFSDMLAKEKVAFLPWMVNDENAQLTLEVQNKLTSRGRYKRILWGGLSKDSMFEPDLFDSINCIYLPPLRDAEARLRPGRNSRLAQLLINLNQTQLDEAHEKGELHPLEEQVKAFNNSLVDDKGGVLAPVDKRIQDRLTQVLGEVFSQDTSIQFSEVDFRRIVERLQLLFFPFINKADNKDFYRSLEENSLGYNNILYLATVLAEIEIKNNEDEFLKVLLIEEPEAHIHPQLQVKLLKYLEEQAKTRNIQIVVTTHSPVLASSASLESLIHLSKRDDQVTAIQIINCGLKTESQDFLRRWLDVTKSTLFFARGVLFVEGIAEAMLLGELAYRVLKDYNQKLIEEGKETEKLPETLVDAGVSIINMGGINFKHFLQLFCNLEKGTNFQNIPVWCAGITDKDPDPNIMPTFEDLEDGKNPVIDLVDIVNGSENCRLFVSPLRTLEYDLAMQGENLQILLPLKSFNPKDEEVKSNIEKFKLNPWTQEIKEDENAKDKVAIYLLEHINKGEFSQKLADKLKSQPNLQFYIPEYIKKAILWVMGGING